MGRRRKRPSYDYMRAYRDLKGIVSFKVDGRHSNRTLSVGDKNRIRKAANSARKGQAFVPIYRKAGETKTGYAKRLQAFREKYDQVGGSHFRGIFLPVSPDSEITREGFEFKIKNRNFKTQDRFIPLSDNEREAWATGSTADRKKIIKAFLKRNKITPSQLSKIQGLIGANPIMYAEEDLDSFLEQLEKWEGRYTVTRADGRKVSAIGAGFTGITVRTEIP